MLSCKALRRRHRRAAPPAQPGSVSGGSRPRSSGAQSGPGGPAGGGSASLSLNSEPPKACRLSADCALAAATGPQFRRCCDLPRHAQGGSTGEASRNRVGAARPASGRAPNQRAHFPRGTSTTPSSLRGPSPAGHGLLSFAQLLLHFSHTRPGSSHSKPAEAPFGDGPWRQPGRLPRTLLASRSLSGLRALAWLLRCAASLAESPPSWRARRRAPPTAPANTWECGG